METIGSRTQKLCPESAMADTPLRRKFPVLGKLGLKTKTLDVPKALELGKQLFAKDRESVLPVIDQLKFFKEEQPVKRVHYIDAEVGDDIVAISNSGLYLAHRVYSLEKHLDMRISWKDTSINRGVGNYAEGIVRIPRSHAETWHAQKAISRPEAFGFIDVPKVRLMLPIRNQRSNWSSTEIGKFSDYGSMTQWVDYPNPYATTVVLGSLIQDASLGITAKARLPYLPTDCGGSGKRIPFFPGNLARYLRTWKGGLYEDYINALIKCTNRFTLSARTGMSPVVPKVLEHFTKCEPIFSDWIKDERSISVERAPIPSEYDVFSVGSLSYGDNMYWVLPRLLREGILVTETQLAIAIQHNELSRALVSEETFQLSMERKREALKAYRKSERIGQTLESKDIMDEVSMAARLGPITLGDINKFVEVTTNTRGFRRMVRSERLYWPEALERVYIKGPMGLKNLYSNPCGQHGGAYLLGCQEPDYSDLSPEKLHCLSALTEWVKNPIGNPPREVLEDDHILANEVEAALTTKVAIITDDVKLCKSIALDKDKTVLRIPVNWYMRLTYFTEETITSEMLETKYRQHGPWTIFEDSGSLSAGEEKFFERGEMYYAPLPRGRIDHSALWNTAPVLPEDLPDLVEFDDRVSLPPEGWPSRYTFGNPSRGWSKQGRSSIRG
jgi:hypothetical protein